jgi:hypothetical protein
MSLKLREMWGECEKMEPELLRVFVNGLMEMVENRHNASFTLREEPIRACVTQDPRATLNKSGRWEPQEDDLLHQCVSKSLNPQQGFIAFAKDPGNKKRRTMQSAEQRYYSLKREGRW